MSFKNKKLQSKIYSLIIQVIIHNVRYKEKLCFRVPLRIIIPLRANRRETRAISLGFHDDLRVESHACI